MGQLRDVFKMSSEGWNPDAVADEIWQNAMSGWRTSYLGFVALPTAVMLSISAAVAYATTLPQRSVRELKTLSGRISDGVQQLRQRGLHLRTKQPSAQGAT